MKLMQFTGLKDKIGNDIYEGDIMRFNNKAYSKPDDIFKVSFMSGQFCIVNPNCCDKCKNDEGCVSTLSEALFFQGEVIGNIHEHKHLLK